jgi:hypothetical protein
MQRNRTYSFILIFSLFILGKNKCFPKMNDRYSLLLFLLGAFLSGSLAVYADAPHYLRVDVKNNLNDNANCPGWTDTLQWAIKSGDCNSPGGFTPVDCLNDQTMIIYPGAVVRGDCQLNELLIMSHGSAAEPREFCPLCMAHLNTLDQ